MAVKDAKRSKQAKPVDRSEKPQSTRPLRKKSPLGGRWAKASGAYLKLAIAFPIRPLSSDAELDKAIGIVDQLLSRKKPLDEQEQGYLDSLSHEIERYENEHIPIPDVSGAAMLRHLIEAHDVTLSKVEEKTGIKVSILSDMRSGKRVINVRHIEKLAPFFGVAPAVFLD